MASTTVDPSTVAEFLSAAVEHIGGATRPGQVAMAEAVAQAFASGRHLAVQAGTGTGKSLAYLVPAILHARATELPVIISTATIALQRQLAERDLPRLVQAFEDPPTFAIMKGRSNYVCLNKFAVDELDEQEGQESLLSPGELTAMGKQVAMVRDWAQDTETGDRDDLPAGVSNLAWKAVSVTANECLGASRCPFGDVCFAEKAKQKAQEADIIVTNHAMLAIDALSGIRILPEHDTVVIDEAHELDARITSVATSEISALSLTLAARRAGKLGADGKEDKLVDAAALLEAIVPGLPVGRIEDPPIELATIRDALWSVRTEIHRAPDGEAANEPEKNAERQNLSNHLVELHDAVVRIIESAENPADVAWSDGKRLAVAPLSVAGLLHKSLFSDKTVVLTSATLTAGGKFETVAASWGLARGSWDSLDAGTPFTPEKSGILYVARDLPDPGREGLSEQTLQTMQQLIMAAGGRTLGLFSSRRAAEEAAKALRLRVPFDIYCQGDDAMPALVRKFSMEENSCLFGTLTLWQGVDVPGRSCSLVMIDRIPFPRPDDPLLQARKQAADEAGRNGFMEVAATHAALLMAQGAGRLLRHVDDRGVVAVLDNRLATKRYGSFLRASMPPMWYTESLETTVGALQRLIAK